MTVGETSLRNLFYARYQARILSVSLAGGLTLSISFSVPQKMTSRKLDASADHRSGCFRANFPSESGGMPFCIILIAMTPSERASADSVDWHSSKRAGALAPFPGEHRIDDKSLGTTRKTADSRH